MKAYKLVFLLGCLLVTACEDYSEEEVVTLSFVQIFDEKPLTSEADGESQTLIQLTMLGSIPKDKAVVELVTTKGTFLESGERTVQVNLSKETVGNTVRRMGTVRLISPRQAGEGVITAKFSDYSKTKEITFTRAYPDSMTVLLSSPFLEKGYDKSVVVTVQLTRKIGKGKPMTDSPVTLTMTDDQKKSIGFVNPAIAYSNADGIATFTVSLGASTYPGILTLVASTPTQSTPLSRTITLKTIP